MNKEIYKYYHIGDIVRNEGVWGDRLFQVSGFGGNAYLPLAYVFPKGIRKSVGGQCNFDIRDMKLMGADKRPFTKLPIRILLKLIKKGNEEARREFIMRSNNKNN